MYTIKKVLFFAASILIIASCNKYTPENAVRCVMTNFEDEIETNQNLVFTFNKELLKNDSLVDKWMDEDLIKISPNVPGRCKWTSTRELIFSPLEEFPAATDFKVTISDKVTRNASTTLRLYGQTEYEFHTSYLTLIGSHTFWRANNTDQTKIELQTDVKFNIPINPKKAADLLEATINGDKTDFKVLNTRPSKTLSIVFQNPKTTNETAKVKVVLKKIGKSMKEEQFTEKSSVVAVQKLELRDVETVHNGVSGSVFIGSSQPVSSNKLKESITIEPAINFTATADDKGITISSEEFSPDQQYEINVTETVVGIFGGKLKSDFTEDISFGEIAPTIKFDNTKAEYLGAKGSRNVSIVITQSEKVKVTVYKIFQNNIYAFKNRGTDWGYHDEYDETTDNYSYHDYQYYNTDNAGEVIFEKKYKASDLKDYGHAKLLNINFEDKLKEFKGIYVVKVEDNERVWLQDSKIISLSDIGLIVKQDKNAVHVFANSILNTEALKNIEVSIISTSNQELGKVKTDKEGYASFEIPDAYKDFKVGMITASSEDSDFNYVLYNSTLVDNTRFDVGGKRLNASNYDAYIYAERDIYRPGETVHLNTIIRTNELNLPGEMPVKARILLPSGKELQTYKNVLNTQGAFETSIPTSTGTPTGVYTFQVLTGNDVLLGSKNIMVEEFMPDRIKVELKTDKDDYKPLEKVGASFTATNYFGPPAANRNYEVNFSLEKNTFSSKEFERYNFNVSKSAQYYTILRNALTDANGNGFESFEIPAEYQETGLLEGRILATVFDETGRPVNRVKTFNVYTQDVFYGVKTDNDFFSTKQVIKIPVVAVNKLGKALTTQSANVKVIRRKWETILQKQDGQLKYVSQKKEEVVDNKNITIRGANSYYAFTAKESGDYEFRISAPNSESYVSYFFYAYGWGDTYASSFEVNNEGKIDITLDNASYKVGDKAKVLLTCPFDGKVLVTVERDKVLDHFYVESENKTASFNIKLEDKHVPNVYISATLIKPNVNDGMPLTVAYGFAPVMVENPDNKIPVEIICATETRSKTKQTIKIKSKANTEMTIAVVDEGILALKDQKSPNPYNYFYSKRALEVDMYNIYPYLFPEVTSLGGGFDETAKRVNPLTNKRVKLVSVWSGIIHTNTFGNAEFTFDIPQFSGSLRVMAVAYDGKKFGAADKNIKVADPIVISAGIPRFVSPNDKITVAATISNTTKTKTQAIITVKSEGVLQNEINGSISTDIEPNSERQYDFYLLTKNMTGEGKVIITVDAMKEKFTDTTYITARPNATFQKFSGSGNLAGGKQATINFNTSVPMLFSSRKLIVSNSPLVQFGKNLSYLVNYPYGCVEQTVSTAFPQLYYADLAKNLNGSTVTNKNAVNNVQAAIDKLQSMQLSNGALSYWQGGGYESWWGTIYGAHFLIEAQKAGYYVNEKTLNKMYGYMNSRLKTKELEWMYYADGSKKEVIKSEVPYSLYVLALADEAKTSELNYYKSNPELLTQSGRYLIAASFALKGDKKKFYAMLPKGFVNEKTEPAFNGNFYSDFRDMALVLNTLLEVDPQNTQINYMAKQVAQTLLTRNYLNTQESVFGFLAMGKIAKAANKGNVTATITSNGKTIATFDGKKEVVIPNKLIGNNAINITAAGTGKLFYFWEMEGIPTQGTNKEEDNFLEVRRTYKDRNGKVYNNMFFQNDLVVVEIAIRSTNGLNVPNVAITDLLPAGFEIENARITEIPQLEWLKNAAQPDYKDVRDD
ncbi:MAG TPA: MG2 domain-containing protein, partial [Chitinophagales bacterium]|nr:MG2 domain-containing protein [Chitinophagales bacterium]